MSYIVLTKLLFLMNLKISRFTLAGFLLSLLCFTSCSNNDDLLGEDGNVILTRSAMNTEPVVINKDTAMVYFSKVLSKAVYERKDVREFLKKEAMEEFDMNSDVLYALVSNKMISNQSFRDILVSYSSEDTIAAIEKSVPLLNILIPSFDFFDITVSNLDCNDSEIPVALSNEKGMGLYLDGEFIMNIPNGELPDFHTIVVNENSRVIVEHPKTRSSSPNVSFISPNYDRKRLRNRTSRSANRTAGQVGSKAIEAYKFFYKDDGSKDSRAFQRDYIYYGLTPTNSNGHFNRSVTEYISFIEINPRAYYNMSDQQNSKTYDDPKIINGSVSRKRHDFSPEELIKSMWSDGAYNFRFEIFSSNSSRPTVVYIPLKPADIWDFNYNRSYRHGTWFRKKKFTYSIDPQKFTSKKVDLEQNQISFGKWDLSQEALERYVSIFEEDKSTTEENSIEYELTKLTSAKVNGDIKVGIGTGGSSEVSSEINTSTTSKETKKYSYTRKEEDDALGTAKIYFYDPIIESKSGNDYIIRTYNTGIVTFGITVQ